MSKEFGIRLRGIRKSAGHTTVSAAKALGVSQPTYNTWELGTREPNIGMLLELCALFDTTPNDLLGMSAAPTSAPLREIKTGDINGNVIVGNGNTLVAPPLSTSTSQSTSGRRRKCQRRSS